MNERLLKSRISSIEHYNEEIIKLNETATELHSIQKDLVKSLEEFCPFEKGDIICKDNLICVFDKVKQAWHNGREAFLVMIVLIANPHNYGRMTKENEEYYYFNKPDEWVVLKHAKKEVEDGI